MPEKCYNKENENQKKKPWRLEQIFGLIRNEEKYLTEWQKGRIEIHFAGDSATISITKF